jgi:hypothetical protein
MSGPRRIFAPFLRAPYVVPAIAYAVVCVAMWPFPLFGILHVESAAVVAGVGFFASGVAALFLFRGPEPAGPVMLRQVALLAIPWLLLTITLLWRPNCGYAQGMMLFATFALPSVALGVALAYAISGALPRWRLPAFVATGILVSVLPPLYDLGLHPQLFTYNHVWGGVLGPLYDEELAIRPGLFFFRGLTLWWAALLLLVGARARMRQRGEAGADARSAGLALLAVAIIVAATYAAAPWLGINMPSRVIQERLGGHVQTEQFDIYFDPEALSEGEVQVILDEHAYRYHQLRERLGVDVPMRIATYLYPDPETKAALTGSRATSVAPTWLPTPQIHMLQDRFEGSFAHELAHVVAREFGMPVLRASPAVGLVEGLAVAVEPPDGLPSVHAQVAAALRHREELGVYGDSLAAGVSRQLRPTGFWTGRGAVSYVTMGSFVRFLLDLHGPEPLREAYASGDLERAYGAPVDSLAVAWEQFVRQQPDDPEATALVMARFARPSLFEVRCPHYVPPAVRHLRAARLAVASGDSARAEAAFNRAFAADSASTAVLTAWAGFMIGTNRAEAALPTLRRAASRADTLAPVALLARLADAERVAGRAAAADTLYARALERLPGYAHEARAGLHARAALPPAGIAALLAPKPAADRAEALETIPGGHTLAALLWAEAGQHGRALETLDAAAGGDVPRGQVLAWQSAFAHASGDRVRAATLAEEAAAAFQADGAAAAATRLRDRVALLRWLILREP